MTEDEFAEAKKFWLMFQANETFKAVHQGCLELISAGLTKESPLYFPLEVGLICLYCKPFKANKGLPKGEDKLPIKMVPEEHLPLHKDLIFIRDKLYAHSDATKTVTLGTLHFNELRVYRDKPRVVYFIDRLHIEAERVGDMAKLAERMVEKTQYYLDKLKKSFNRHVPRREGEFLLNIKDQG